MILGILAAVIVAIVAIWIMSLRCVVPTDEVHILQTSSKTLSYGKDKENGNVYYAFPEWLPKLGVSIKRLPTAVFDLDLIGYEAYDKDRVPICVDVKAFFRISDSNVAANRIETFDTLREQLMGIVQGASRTLLANEIIHDIMGKRSEYGDKFTQAIINELKDWGVEPVKNIELMDIRDNDTSNAIANIMSMKQSQIEKEARIEVATNRKSAEEAEILADQEVKIKQAQANRETGIADEQAAQIIAEQKRVTKEKDMEIVKVQAVKQAEINKEAATIAAEQDKDIQVIKANADKEQIVIDTDAQKIKTETLAIANLTEAQKNAEGIKAVGEAEAEAKKQMELASVTAQTTLAAEIGSNKEYQSYLITIEQVKAAQEVGVAQAQNLGKAEIKVIANAGDVNTGVNKAMDLFSGKGGLAVGNMLENLSNTDMGKNILNKFLGDAKEEPKQ